MTTSVVMGILILLTAIHRKTFNHRISSKVYYYIWLLIGIKLLLPFNFSFAISNGDSSNLISGVTAVNDNKVEQNLPIVETVNEEAEAETYKNDFISMPMAKEEAFAISQWQIWLAGMSVYFVVNLLSYWHYKRGLLKNSSEASEEVKNLFSKLKESVVPNRKIRLVSSNSVKSALLMGVFRPVVVMSNDYDLENMQYIFTHELIHFKRRDTLYKLIIFLAKGIHWFNPLVHLMGKMASEDVELSCDEEVLKIGKVDRRNYSQCLLMEISKGTANNRALTVNYTGGLNFMKKRIDNVFSSFKKKSPKSLIAICMMIILISGSLTACDSEAKVIGLEFLEENIKDDVMSYYFETKTSYTEGEELIELVSKHWYDYDGENVSLRDYIEFADGNIYQYAIHDGMETLVSTDQGTDERFAKVKKYVPQVDKQLRIDRRGKAGFANMIEFFSRDYDIEAVGDETVNGRDTLHVKFTPKKTAAIQRTLESITNKGVSVPTYFESWYDKETWLSLDSYDEDDKPKNVKYEIIKYEINPKLTAEDFTIEIPDGIEVQYPDKLEKIKNY